MDGDSSSSTTAEILVDQAITVSGLTIRSPLTPESREPDPQEPVGGSQTHPVCTGWALKDQELMPKGKDLGLNRSASSKSLPN